jgi:hypothetical protein
MCVCVGFLALPLSLYAQGYYIQWAVAVDNSNNIIVTDQSDIGPDEDYLTVKYSPDGTILWIDTLDNGSSDWVYGIAVNAFDNIIVTGTSTIGGTADYYTVKYALDTRIAEDAEDNACPSTFDIHPNPFHERLNITFQNPNSKNRITMGIFNISGRCVKFYRLKLDTLRATQISWDGCNEKGEQLPSGVYIIAVKTEKYQKTNKVLLLG